MNTMTHKGYTARIEFDDAHGIFFGRILGPPCKTPPPRMNAGNLG